MSRTVHSHTTPGQAGPGACAGIRCRSDREGERGETSGGVGARGAVESPGATPGRVFLPSLSSGTVSRAPAVRTRAADLPDDAGDVSCGANARPGIMPPARCQSR